MFIHNFMLFFPFIDLRCRIIKQGISWQAKVRAGVIEYNDNGYFGGGAGRSVEARRGCSTPGGSSICIAIVPCALIRDDCRVSAIFLLVY